MSDHEVTDREADVGAGQEPATARPRRRWLRRTLVGAGGLLVVVLVALGVLWATTPDPRGSSPGWERLADAPHARGEVASATGCVALDACAQDRLYVLGGISGAGTVPDTATVYDPAADRWEELPPTPAPRHHAAAAVLDGTLYFLGGTSSLTSWSPEATAWAYTAEAGEWEEIAAMPEPRLGHRAVALDGRLYVVGGDGGAAVLIFEPGQGWSTGAEIPRPRDHLMAVALDGEVWAIGGREDGLATDVDVYDPRRDAWRDGPALPRGMSASVAGVLGDGIHVVGGEDPSSIGGGVIDRHVVLPTGGDDLAREWQDAPLPLVAVHGAAGGVIGDRLIVSAGSRRQGAYSMLGWTALTAVYDPGAAG